MAVAPFDIQSTVADRVHRVSVHGELDLATAPVLARRFEELAGPTLPVIEVDLAGVSFIDGSGLRVLLAARERFSRDGPRRLELVRASKPVARLFELVGVEDQLAQ